MKTFKGFKEFINEDMSRVELKFAEKLADQWFSKYGIDIEFTKHFLDRLNDRRNNPHIEFNELVDMFKKSAEQIGKDLSIESDVIQAVLKDVSTELNIPFVLEPDPDPREKTKFISKTIMRKRDFKTSNKVFKV